MDNYKKYCSISNYNVFYKDNTNVSKLYATTSAIFETCFGLWTFGIVILYTTKQYKVKNNYKKITGISIVPA
jgi:hypothetical protein